MKLILSTIATLSIAASAHAHATGMPHTHGEVNAHWPIIAILGLVIAAGALLARKLSNRSHD